jgi:hypothetical protein
MNSKERVLTAFKHEEPDRVPVTELYINSPVASDIIGREAWTGWGGHIRCGVLNKMLIEGRAEEFYQKEAEDLVEVYRTAGLDTIMIERPPLKNPIIPRVLEENVWKFEAPDSPMWGVVKYCPGTDLYHEMDSNITQGGIKSFEEYVELLEKDTIDLDTWSFKQAEYILEKCRKDMFVMAVVEIYFPPMAFNSWGGVFLECMAFRPDLVERYLDYWVRKGLIFVEKYAQMGVDGIFDGEDLAGTTGPLFSSVDFRRFYVPRFQKIIEACHKHGLLYVRHTDGDIMPFEKEFFVDMGIDAFHSVDPEAGMDIGLLKKKYGDKITLWGNVDCGRTLTLGSPEDVIRETKQVMKVASPGGGHVLTSSNTVTSDTPTKNFLAMVETVKEFGKYPINIDVDLGEKKLFLP